MNNKINLLLIGCGGAAGFNFVESLHMQKDTNFNIIGTDCNPYHLELSNCDKTYLVPSCSETLSYIKKIHKIIKDEKIEFIHMQPDVEVEFWSDHRHLLSKWNVKYSLPDSNTIDICMDKYYVTTLLEQAGFPVAKQDYFGKLINITDERLNYFSKKRPLWIRARTGAGSKAAFKAYNAEEVKFWIKYWCDHKGLLVYDFLISEYLPGKEYAVQTIWMNGYLVSAQARERVEYVFGNLTVTGQSSSPSVARTVDNKIVYNTAINAIKTITEKPNGIFCVDMKENGKGIPCVTEINAGRFFTTSDFFSKAGANMPYVYVMFGADKSISIDYLLEEVNPIKPDIYWIRMMDMGKKMVNKNV